MLENPDIIIINAEIKTMDALNPRAGALAISGNLITAIGSTAEISAMKGVDTRIIDAAGNTVLPGFIESHLHVFPGGAELDHCDLSGVHGVVEFRAKIQEYVKDRPGKGLVMAQSADYTMLSEAALITRHDLDSVMSDRPLLIFAPDHHTAWANTCALQLAGILNGASLGIGNEIVMALDGMASGELREGEAFAPILALSKDGERVRLGLSTGDEPDPPPTPEERENDLAIMRRSLAYLARHGITSFHNMDGNLYQLELIQELMDRGEFFCRAKIPFHFLNYMPLEALEKASAMHQRFQSERLSSGLVKMFMDGVIDSGTAALLDDYADQPGVRGDPLFTADRFNEIVTEADRRGLQVAVHAIGDRAVRMVLDGYQAARTANGPRDSRHRIEHIELIHPDDIPRLSELDVLGSVQPPHAPGGVCFPMQPTASRIGEKRWPYAYAWNSLRDAGARLVFASDWPVSPVDPMLGIKASLTRDPWMLDLPDHRQSLDQALHGYTADGAYAEFKENRKGRLAIGFLADIVILSADLETVSPGSVSDVHPVITICDGTVTYEKS